MPYAQLLLNLNFSAILLHYLNLYQMHDYCVPVLLPLGVKDLAAMPFSTNLAFQRLTGSEGEDIISNMLTTDWLWRA